MKFQLPLSGKSVEIKDWMPHGVHAKVQATLTKSLKIDLHSVNPTKSQVLLDLPPEEQKRLDALPPAEYEKEFARHREDFVKRQIKMEGLSLESAEEANMIRVEGMVTSMGGHKPTVEELNDLPEPDFQAILDKISEIEERPLVKGSSEPSDS